MVGKTRSYIGLAEYIARVLRGERLFDGAIESKVQDKQVE